MDSSCCFLLYPPVIYITRLFRKRVLFYSAFGASRSRAWGQQTSTLTCGSRCEKSSVWQFNSSDPVLLPSSFHFRRFVSPMAALRPTQRTNKLCSPSSRRKTWGWRSTSTGRHSVDKKLNIIWLGFFKCQSVAYVLLGNDKSCNQWRDDAGNGRDGIWEPHQYWCVLRRYVKMVDSIPANWKRSKRRPECNKDDYKHAIALISSEHHKNCLWDERSAVEIFSYLSCRQITALLHQVSDVANEEKNNAKGKVRNRGNEAAIGEIKVQVI